MVGKYMTFSATVRGREAKGTARKPNQIRANQTHSTKTVPQSTDYILT